MTRDQVLRALFEKLATVYAMPAQKMGQAEAVAARCPAHATEEQLENLATRIIETRKQKTFPSAQELMQLVKALPAPGSGATFQPQGHLDEIREKDGHEKQAIAMLAGTGLAREACRDRWGPALIDFATENGRAPDAHEVRSLVAVSRKNDAEARDCEGSIGFTIRKFREVMHETAARRLGVTDWLTDTAEAEAA